MCRMDFRARFVRGLTFRFAGEEGELDVDEGETDEDEGEVEATPVG